MLLESCEFVHCGVEFTDEYHGWLARRLQDNAILRSYGSSKPHAAARLLFLERLLDVRRGEPHAQVKVRNPQRDEIHRRGEHDGDDSEKMLHVHHPPAASKKCLLHNSRLYYVQ